MAAFAKGTHALGQCQRCGFVFKRSKLKQDGDTRLLVCSSCFDVQHPAERPRALHDAVALQRPAPDLDEAASRVITTGSLVEELGFDQYFGGGT